MKPAQSTNPVEQPIFIIGVGRSGTTLLQAMLHAHKLIAFTPETHFIRRYLARRRVRRLLDRGYTDRFLEAVEEDSDLNRLGLDFAPIITQLKNREALSLISFYKTLLEIWREEKGAAVVGDKDPKNIEFLRFIHDYFPAARIIHIVRDPRAVVLSRMKAEWSRHRGFLSHVAIYNLQLQKGIRDGRNLFGRNYYEIIYEDLVTNPEQQCEQLCQWLNIPFDPGMLNFQQSSHEIIKGREINWKGDCFKPVQPANKDKWTSGLNRRQICVIETLNSPWFSQFGYRKSGYLKDRSLTAAVAHAILKVGMWKLDMGYRFAHWLKYQLNRRKKK